LPARSKPSRRPVVCSGSHNLQRLPCDEVVEVPVLGTGEGHGDLVAHGQFQDFEAVAQQVDLVT
jgi:hypothetical protein